MKHKFNWIFFSWSKINNFSWPKIFHNPKFFIWPEIFYDPKFFITQNFLYGPKIFRALKFFQDSNFCDPIFFGTRNFWASTIWDPQFFMFKNFPVPKFSGTKTFPNPVYFWDLVKLQPILELNWTWTGRSWLCFPMSQKEEEEEQQQEPCINTAEKDD